MKKMLSLVLVLAMAAGCLCALVAANAETETWYVKTANGKDLNVRDIVTEEKIGTLPYGAAVEVEFFNQDHWAIILWKDGEAKVKEEFLVPKYPGAYNGPTNAQGTVLTDSVLGSETVEGLNKQYAALKYVEESYTVKVVPDTRTGTARLRWAPSKNATLVAQLPANYELTVLAASSNWLMVQDPVSGKIGFIAAKYTGEV